MIKHRFFNVKNVINFYTSMNIKMIESKNKISVKMLDKADNFDNVGKLDIVEKISILNVANKMQMMDKG